MDLATGTFLQNWPKWLRWVLFLPAAFIVPFLFALIQNIAIGWFAGINTDAPMMQLYNSIILGGGFVFIGAMTAPHKQFLISIMLLVLLTILSISGYVISSYSEDFDTLLSVIPFLILIGSGIFAVYYLHKEGYE